MMRPTVPRLESNRGVDLAYLHTQKRTSYQRNYEIALVAVFFLVSIFAAIFTYSETERDYDVTLTSSYRLADSLAEGLEGQFISTFRDAENAATSAIILIERSGGPLAFHTERRVHDELKRELWEETSTRRLMLLDANGHILASSAEFPVRQARAPRDSEPQWDSTQLEGRTFKMGLPQLSLVDDEMVIPYSSGVYDSKGRLQGFIRAELRLAHFTSLYGEIANRMHGAVVVMTADGYAIVRAPAGPMARGPETPEIQVFLNQAHGESGNLEYKAGRDGVVRFYSWRKFKARSLIIAVGLDRDVALQPWRQRTSRLTVVIGLACAALATLILGLVAYMRRAVRNHADIEMRYWAAMERSSIGVGIASMNGDRLYVNAAMCSMLGYTREEFSRLPWGAPWTAESNELIAECVAEFQRGRDQSIDREIFGISKDGATIWFAMHLSVLRGTNGTPSELLFYLQDITDRKQAERALHELNEDLERRVAERTAALSRSNKDLEAFSYSAAHDLQGPLAILMGFADLLKKDLGNPSEKIVRRIDTIKRQVRQMANIVESLLALSRVSRTKLRKTRVDLNGLVGEVCESLKTSADERNVQWHIGPLPEVWADAGLPRIALTNLLGNALKYSQGRDPAIIEVGATLDTSNPRETTFFIRDNGAGFDMKYAGDLFEPFKRLHHASQFEGTGIGLAMVHRIIESNGGRISAVGETERGATFTVTLPAYFLD